MECLASLEGGSDGFFQEALLADCKRVSSGFVDDELSGSHMAGIMPVHKNGRARRLAHYADDGAGGCELHYQEHLAAGSGFNAAVFRHISGFAHGHNVCAGSKTAHVEG